VIWALFAAVLAVLVGVFILRPRVSGLFRGDFQGIKTEAFVGPVVTLAVFLTAFVVAQATTTFQRTNQAVSQEAASVELLFENAGLLPDGSGDDLRASAVCYARSVARLEFPALAEGGASPETEWWAGEFNQQVPDVLDGPGSVVGQVVSLNRQQTEARAARLFDAKPNLPVLTLAILVGAVIGVMLVITTLAVPDMRRRVVLALALLLAALLGGTLFMIEQLEEPFTGIIRVQPGAVENAIARMESQLPTGEVLPCDRDGRPLEPGTFAIVERGETPLVVCTDAPYPPFEYEDPTGDSPSGYTGFDIDLAQNIADGAGRTLVISEQPFDRIFRAVRVGQCDAAISAISITPEREEIVDFSRPYLQVDQAMLVPSNELDVAGLDDLSGSAVGVLAETTGELFVEANRPPGVKIVEFATPEELLDGLRTGRVAAIVEDAPVAELTVRGDPTLRVAATFPTAEQLGIAVAPGDTETRELFDRGLEAARADGTLNALNQRYLPGTPS
jgi:polar amino acid transport system substrate-binding protein